MFGRVERLCDQSMIWYDDLYLSQNIETKAEKLKWKMEHNAGMLHMYAIALAKNSDNLLEIIDTKELMQKRYPKRDVVIVGIAKGYDEAVEVAATIIVETMNERGDTRVKDYLIQRRQKRRQGE